MLHDGPDTALWHKQRVVGLICLGYPFHPPGRPDTLDTRHLEELTAPTLILQGGWDPFGRSEEMAGCRLLPAIRVHWLEDGNHSFRSRKGSGRTETGNRPQAMAPIIDFITGLG